jgi:hypothetical protein
MGAHHRIEVEVLCEVDIYLEEGEDGTVTIQVLHVKPPSNADLAKILERQVRKGVTE